MMLVSTLDWQVCVWDQKRSQRLEEALPAMATKHSATEDEGLSLSRFTASPAVSTAQHWDTLQSKMVSHMSNWRGEKKMDLMGKKKASRKSLTLSTRECFHKVNFVNTKVSYTCWYRVVSAGWINEMPVVVWLCGKGKFWWKQRAPCSSCETLESFHKKHWHFL